MKKLITIIIITLLLPFVAFAHPGSLDANGGHYNRKTGEYHYHSGIHKYGTSSSSTTKTYYPYTPKPTVNATQAPTTKPVTITTATPEPKAEKRPLWEKILLISLFVLLATGPVIEIAILLYTLFFEGLFMTLYDWIKERIYDAKLTRTTKKVAPEQPKPTVQVKTEPPQQQKKIVTVPSGYAIGSDGLPYKINRQYGWGREFNVFVTNNGEHYHRSKCKTIKGKKRKLMHRYNAIKRYEPCAYCKPKGYIDNWFIDYKGADRGKDQLSFKE